MSFCGRRQDKGVIRDLDIEGQTRNKAEVKTSSVKKKKEKYPRLLKWTLVSCVLSVAADPLFFYLPVIEEERKCVAFDQRLYITNTCLRTVLDSISLGDIIWQRFCRPYIDKNARLPGQDHHGVSVTGIFVSTNLKIARARSKAKIRYLCSLAIDVLAILPIPQVLLPIIFSKPRGSESLNKRKVLIAVVLFQYLPRAIRICQLSVSWRKAFAHVSLSKSVIAVKAGLNLVMFIVASHILGGFWYFLSIQRETACWHHACENHIECNRSSFDCDDGSVGNYTLLNDYCPIQTPNTTVFDFGMFQGALQSGTVQSMDFPRKILYCFWWGLRNLSSFGSNLQTSPYIWENCFAVVISISGLLLFMYFLGRLQMYMQWEASRQLEDARQRQLEEARKWKLEETKQLEKLMKRWKFKMKAKILGWIDRQPRLKEIRKEIIEHVDRMFTEEENRIMSVAEENISAAINMISRSGYKDIVDAENPLPHFPLLTRREIQHLLCLPLLQKVPLLQNESEDTLKLISRDFLKQVSYKENSYIVREGEPLVKLLFITRGIIEWTSTTTSPAHRPNRCLKTDDFYGDELLEWVFKSPSLSDPSNLPLSTRTLRCQTKVEAFALTACDIKLLLYQHWWKFSKFREMIDSNEQLQNFAASKIQAAFRHWHHAQMKLDDQYSDKKAAKSNELVTFYSCRWCFST